MLCHIDNNQTDLPLNLKAVEALVHQVLATEGKTAGEISILFVSDPEMCEIHNTHFNDPSPTDCMSFPIDPPIPATDTPPEGHCLGSVIVCPNTAITWAAENNGDPYEETALYTAHGLLHLMGYDDINKEDIIEMRAAEKRAMESLAASKIDLKEES